MKKANILSVGLIWSLSASALHAAALVLNIDSGGLTLQSANGIDLTGGGASTPYDGEIIQVGYFSGATSNDNNFSGTWIPLTGEGSLNYVPNTLYDTTVGDDFTQGFGPPFNQFQISLPVDTAIQTQLPAPGTILSIRVYDRATIAASTSFMTLSSNLWKWIVPTTLQDPSSKVDMSFAADFLRVENRSGALGLVSTPSGDAANTASGSLRTSTPIIPVPEPSSSLLLLGGCVAFFARRKK